MAIALWFTLGALLGTQAAAMNLPLVVLPPTAPATSTLVILLTGDGGWSYADKRIAEKLAGDGEAVVALNSFHYFQHHHTSQQVASDVSSIARLYCERFQCRRIALVGYSMGADVLPFVEPQLDNDVRHMLKEMILVSLGHNAVFKFLPTQWVGLTFGKKFPTLPRIASISDVPIVCVYGTGDQDQACLEIPAGKAELVALPGGHVMSKVADELADSIVAHVQSAR